MLQRRPSSRKSLFLCIFRSHPTTRAPPPRALVDDLQTAVAAAGPPPEAAAPPHNNGAAGVTLERQFTVPAPIYLCSAAANLGSSMRNAGGARVPSWMARLSRQRRCLKSVTSGAWSARRALLPLCCPSSAPIMSAKTARPIPGLGRRGRPPRRITPSLAPAAWTPAASGDACPAVEGANG
ncbi:hypothetical protein VPH35_033083 [Triticum aestivum]|uniref:uncharacterized protein n=1 Tax=Triticum aestivum TaxID=4565 RepID=UPI001D0335D2|nr:uncharacterized protein LOC123042864 [Triticum aestivum]